MPVVTRSQNKFVNSTGIIDAVKTSPVKQKKKSALRTDTPVLLNIAITEQQQRNRMRVSQALPAHSRLAELGVRRRACVSDGNCQFRAISDQLYGTQKYHSRVRTAVCQHIIQHKQEYSPFFDHEDYENFDDYLSDMFLDGTWGDNITLLAASAVFDIVIDVYNAHEIKQIYNNIITSSKQVIRLYLDDEHYTSVVDHSK